MADQNENLRQVFEALKTEVNRIAGEESQNMLLRQARDRSGLVRSRYDELDYIREVRHKLSHPKISNGVPAFHVTAEFVLSAKAHLSALQNPKTSGKMGIAIQDLYVANTSTSVEDIASEMKAKKYTHVPIVDKAGVVAGVFNEAAIFDYLITDKIIELNSDTAVEGLMDHCKLGRDHTETFVFRNPRETEDTVIETFLKVTDWASRVGAIFVTASGKSHEPLQRMITAWDALNR
jgi:CBS domain-containing protein